MQPSSDTVAAGHELVDEIWGSLTVEADQSALDLGEIELFGKLDQPTMIVVKRADIPAGAWPQHNEFPAAEYLEVV